MTHHVSGYLKIAPEHTEEGPLSKNDETGHRQLLSASRQLFEKFSAQAGKSST